MIIDSHVHIGRLDDSPYAATTFEQNLASLLKEMRSAGVDKALILPGYRKHEKTDPLMRTVLKVTEGRKNVFITGSIDVLDHSQDDIDELDGLMAKRRIIGIKLYPGYQHFFPYDPVCEPIYKLCLKHDVPVIFHSGDTLSTGETAAKVRYAHPLAIDDVAADHPDLKIVIAHMGNPWFLDCAEVLYKNNNVYADLSGLVVRTPLDSPYGRLLRAKINELIVFSSPRKLLYGTDWPLGEMKPYLKFVKSLGLGKTDLDYVMYKNAAWLFGV
jgi:hypothetical protein